MFNKESKMFRRPTKETASYEEEQSLPSPFNFPSLEGRSQEINSPRVFETHGTPASSKVQREWKEENWQGERNLAHPFQEMGEEEEPDTLGEGVNFRGELKFEGLLRIDGEFEGELISPQGKVIVGPRGKIQANLNLKEAVIEGTVVGNITVEEKLELRGHAKIEGDIVAKALIVDDGVSISGHLLISPPSET